MTNIIRRKIFGLSPVLKSGLELGLGLKSPPIPAEGSRNHIATYIHMPVKFLRNSFIVASYLARCLPKLKICDNSEIYLIGNCNYKAQLSDSDVNSFLHSDLNYLRIFSVYLCQSFSHCSLLYRESLEFLPAIPYLMPLIATRHLIFYSSVIYIVALYICYAYIHKHLQYGTKVLQGKLLTNFIN